MCRIPALLALAGFAWIAAARADDRVLAAVQATDPMAVEALLKDPRGLSAGELALLSAEAAGMRFDDKDAIETLTRALGGPEVGGALRRQMLSLLGSVQLRSNNYAAAAEALEAALAVTEPSAEGRHSLEQTHLVAKTLRGEPAQIHEVKATSAVAIKRDAANLARAVGRVNGLDEEFILDTGAGMSTITRSAAVRLSVRMLEGPVSVGSATSASVPAHIGVADSVEIAGNRFRNVVFLVMADEALTFGSYKIDAILGFPVLSRLGRIEFARTRAGEVFRVGAPSAGVPSKRDLYLDVLRPMVIVDVSDAGPVRMLLDSGAKSSSFSKLFADTFPALMRNADTQTVTIGGAGARKTIEVKVLKNVAMGVDGRVRRVGAIDVSKEGRGEHGAVGQDVLRAEGGFALDFTTMDFSFLPDAPQ